MEPDPNLKLIIENLTPIATFVASIGAVLIAIFTAWRQLRTEKKLDENTAITHKAVNAANGLSDKRVAEAYEAGRVAERANMQSGLIGTAMVKPEEKDKGAT